ncbi:ribonuclease Z [Bacillus sp. FJAT-45350]|uniref:ribonuclease Z n=1 Tax=Bacillus sp. FJAT-45350 TaxID=2011014 RepID=UPI000BB7CDFC|nr:ribonuclease Z [Bacillus sp. FJAT-45350]
MEIHFLGTGAGVPSTKRNVSSTVIRFLQQNGRIWMFDCGEATQQQILSSPIKLSKLDKIFITHLHGDHIFGLPGLLGSRSFQGGTTPLTIFGPKGIKEFIETTIRISNTHLMYELSIIEIDDNHEGEIFSDGELTVTVYSLDHVMPCLGYRIIEADKQGELNVEKLKKARVQPGPLYKQLKNREVITLEDGRIINGADFIGPSIPGRVVAIAGDTRKCDATMRLANNADVLIHEATFCVDEASLACQFGHATTKEAAEIAKKANVSTLILTHISSRYQNKELEMEKEAKSFFENTFIAEDFFVFHLNMKNKEQKINKH